MTTSLTDDLLSQLQGPQIAQIGEQLGLSGSQASSAVSTALPLLLGALGRNSSQPQGAEALFGALQKDHAGLDLGSVLGAVMGGGGQGAQILGHIFGGQQPRAEQALGQATGLGNDRAGALLKMLAPIVLAYLAKRMFEQRQADTGAAPSTPKELGEVLGQEQQRVSQQGGLGGSVLGAVLDQDGDGQVGLGDLLKIGGGLFGGRR